MEFNETDGGPLLEDKEMVIVRTHDKQVSLFISIALIVDGMLPLSPHNILQLKVGMLVYGQVPAVFQHVGNVQLLREVPDMHLSKLQVIHGFLQYLLRAFGSTLWYKNQIYAFQQ
jgi:hypothetical protein